MSKFLSILLMSFCLLSCSGERCIEADDFGFANFTISARYTQEELSGQSGPTQVAPWRNSNYRVNGKPLTILVHGWTPGSDKNKPTQLSAWCAWYGQSDNAYTLSSFCERLQDCQFVDNQMCSNTKDARIGNAPCLFRNGVGLYALIAEKNTNPNLSISSQQDPSGLTFHLGEPTNGYSMYDIDRNGNTRQAGGLIYNYDSGGGSSGGSQDELKQKYQDSELYFKILDKFYDDNSGQYRISIKSGVTDVNPDPITFVTNLVKKFLFGADGNYGLIRSIYTGIINNPAYQIAVSAILSLYIIWTALSYLTGNIELTQTELIVRILKIGIVSALLNSNYSWSFFNDYLFVWFVGGMGQILQMVIDAGATGPGASSIFGLMIAPQTIAKLVSLLFVDWLGFIYIILFFFALYFIVIIVFDAAVIYLTALISIGLIIIMGPIFICFLLFGITKSLFENWLKQLISYAIQPLILFTGLVFISLILRQEIYSSLGFRVCKQTFPKLSIDGGEVLNDITTNLLGFDVGDSLFYWWFPEPMKGEKFTRNTVNMPIPVDHYTNSDNSIVSSGGNDAQFCEAYACVGPRYIDLPFLDPVKDTRRINQFWNGKFVQLDGMLLIFVAIYLLHKFNSLAISIAKFITGTSGNFTDIKSVADNASGGIRSRINQAGNYVKGRLANTSVGRTATKIVNNARAVGQGIKQIPSRIVDKIRISELKKDALSSNPNKIVVDEVRKISGLNHHDIKHGAIKDYKNALKSELKKIDPSLTDRQAKKIASQMSKRSFKNLDQEFAKAKYGKDFNKLNSKEKMAIKAITEGKYSSLESTKALRNEFAKAKYGKDFSKLKPQERLAIKAIMEDKNNDKLSNENLKDRLAEAKYGKGFDKLTSEQRKEVKLMSERAKIKETSLRELANNAQMARQYSEAYVNAYAKLSERGVGLFGKHSSTIKSLDELKHNADRAQQLKELKRKNTGEQLYAGLEEIKHKATGGVFGRSFNEIDTNAEGNYRMQTYNEIMAESQRQRKYVETAKKIETLSKEKGQSVISPEFLARAKSSNDPNLNTYKTLAKEDLKEAVRTELTKGEDPALKGEKFMEEYAKDSQMSHMIDRAEEVKAEMLKNDEFVQRQEQYENKSAIAEEAILDKKEILEEHFNMNNITEQEMPVLLEKYNQEKGIDPETTKQEVLELKKTIEEFKSSEAVLEQIQERKASIVEEVDKHIGNVNEYRKKAKMPEYVPPKTSVGTRSKRKIEDLRRGK